MEIEKYLNEFGKLVVKQSRTNLTKKKKNDRGELYKSISYDLEVFKNSFSLSFSMEDYGKFVDKGVKGVISSQKAPNSPFKYTTKRPPTKALDGWVKRKISGARNEKGQFVKRESIKFAIANKIFLEGLETTNFFERPFELAFKKLPDDIVKAYALDVENLLKFSLK